MRTHSSAAPSRCSTALDSRLLALALISCALTLAAARASDLPWIVRGNFGIVASDSHEASRIGAEILEQGGNAFDAAIATSFALGVTRPESTGLGGGGFMVAYVARNKHYVALDFRETAPNAATAERYAKAHAALESIGEAQRPPSLTTRGANALTPYPSPSIYGGNAIATPGLAAGYAAISRNFGSIHPMKLAVAARKLAESGFTADEFHVIACRELAETLRKYPDFESNFALIRDIFLPGGVPPAVGDTIKRPDLAAALKIICDHGLTGIYDGYIGLAMVEAAQKAGGTLTMDDLRGYSVKPRQPVIIQYRDYEIISMPPPSSGGICIAQSLQILDQIPAWDAATPRVLRSHLLIESMKHAFADRSRWLGDPDFSTIPTGKLLSRAYAGSLAARISATTTQPAGDYGTCDQPTTRPATVAPPGDRGTSHLCVWDRDGNVVALTETINGAFGSLVVAEPYGIVLNNQMDDFTTVPGEPNLFGLTQSEANVVAPGKRPLSSMSPTIVARDGRPLLALGASGGPRIISSVLNVLLNVVEFRMPLDQAMTALRLHHQWKPDEVRFDRDPAQPAYGVDPFPDLASALGTLGHAVSELRGVGAVTAIQKLRDGLLVGVSDPRKAGRPEAAKPRN